MKSKCFHCKKRRKYGVEIFVYRKSLFRSVRKYFACYSCVGEIE